MAEALDIAKDSARQRTDMPRQRDADQTKASILESALAEFADKGLAGARVDEIAKKTSTSKHMIYYYFGNKERLYRAVLENAYQNFRLAEEAVDYDRLDPVEALTSLVGLTFDFHVGNPQSVRIIMGENLNSGEHIHHVSNVEQRRVILDLMAAIVNRGAAAGQFRPGIDMLQLHMSISALCFYFVANRYSFGHIFGVDLQAPEMIATRRAEVIDAALSICMPRGD
jgi:AcrR family transcriptional regulator